jgi:hypothetical protein
VYFKENLPSGLLGVPLTEWLKNNKYNKIEKKLRRNNNENKEKQIIVN